MDNVTDGGSSRSLCNDVQLWSEIFTVHNVEGDRPGPPLTGKQNRL